MHMHTYTPLDATHIPCTMNQQPFAQAPSHTSNPESSCTMDLTGVMPQHIQSSENAPWRQPPPHLPFQPSTPSSYPLPSIPPST